MKNTILTAILLLFIVNVYAQNNTDSIEIKKSPGKSFRQNGKKLSPGQLLKITEPNSAAFGEMKIAKRNYNAASVLGFASGFLIGWPLGEAISNRKPHWALAGIGAGLALISTPLNSAYNKHAINAVDIYNKGLKPMSRRKFDINFGLSYSGCRVRIMF